MPFQEFQARRHFGSLDGLRCLSILAVIWHHTGGRAFRTPSCCAHGPSADRSFFVISGFLITTLAPASEKRRTADVSAEELISSPDSAHLSLYRAVLLVHALLVLALERSPSPRAGAFSRI